MMLVGIKSRKDEELSILDMVTCREEINEQFQVTL